MALPIRLSKAELTTIAPREDGGGGGAVHKRGIPSGVGVEYSSLRQLLHRSRAAEAWAKLGKL